MSTRSAWLMAGTRDASCVLCDGVRAALSLAKVNATTFGLRAEPTLTEACGRSATDAIAGTGACAAAAAGTAGTETTAKVLGVVEGHAGSMQLAYRALFPKSS